MRPDPRPASRRAGILVILAAVLWWHAWMPVVIVTAFLAWAVLHTRYQGARRAAFMRLRTRLWPPAFLALAGLIVAGTAIYATSMGAVEAKALPIALNVLAAVTVAAAAWRQVAPE